MSKSLISLIVLGVVLFTTAYSTLFTVRETEQVMVLQFGEQKEIITKPGLNFKLPFIQTLIYFDKRILDYDASIQEVPTADQKQLIVDSFSRYRIVDPLLFYQTVFNEIGMRQRLDALINDSLRAILGKVPLSEVLTPKRSTLIDDFTKLVAEKAREFGVEMVDVRIKRIDLPPENSQAIFRRMQTQREQEARKIRAEGDKESRRIRADADKQQRVILAEARKKAEILRGEGDAEAQRLYNAAYSKDEDFFDFWRSMQAMQKALIGDSTSFIGAPDGDFFRYFNKEANPNK